MSCRRPEEDGASRWRREASEQLRVNPKSVRSRVACEIGAEVPRVWLRFLQQRNAMVEWCSPAIDNVLVESSAWSSTPSRRAGVIAETREERDDEVVDVALDPCGVGGFVARGVSDLRGVHEGDRGGAQITQ